MRANTRKCDVWRCSVHTLRRLQQIAISCKRSCYNNFFLKKNMSSTSFHSTATMRYWKKKTNATFGIDKKELVQVARLQIRGAEVWSEFHRCISVWFVQWDIPVFLTSLVLLRGWDTSPWRIVGQEMLFLCVSFAVRSTTRSLFSDDVVRDWKSIQSPLEKTLAGFAFN